MYRYLLIAITTLLALPLTAQMTPPNRGKVARPAQRPDLPEPWQRRESATLHAAETGGHPIIMLFTDNDRPTYADSDAKKEIAKYASFVLVPHNHEERTKQDTKLIRPSSCKFLAANASAAYNVPGDRDYLLICDWHGNEVFRMTSLPNADKLTLMLVKVFDRAEDQQRYVEKYLAKARTCMAEGDLRSCLKLLGKIFHRDAWGFAATREAVTLFDKLLWAIRRETWKCYHAIDIEGLQDLASNFERTRLHGFIQRKLEEATEIAASPEEEESF